MENKFNYDSFYHKFLIYGSKTFLEQKKMYFNFSDFIMYEPRGNSKAAGETWLCIVCGQRNQEVNQEAMRLVCSSFYTVHLCCRCINELPNSVIISSIWDTASLN